MVIMHDLIELGVISHTNGAEARICALLTLKSYYFSVNNFNTAYTL